MRAAPPAVEVTLGAGRRERAMVAGLYALSATALTAWLAQRHLNASAPALVLAAALAGAAFGWKVLRPLQGLLRWDGSGWTHEGADQGPRPLKAVQLQCDLGGWLLLRVLTQHKRSVAWCGVSMREAGAGWHGLRLALYHRPPVAPSPTETS